MGHPVYILPLNQLLGCVCVFQKLFNANYHTLFLPPLLTLFPIFHNRPIPHPKIQFTLKTMPLSSCPFVELIVVNYKYLTLVAGEKKEDEDIYGELDGGDVQKDGPLDPDYYTDGDPENGDDPAENEPANNSVNVKLLSQGEVFIKNVGDVVTLPCRVSPKDVVRVWKKDTTLIFQDRISITENKKYNLTADGDLQVTIESAEDYGQYKCIIAMYDGANLEVAHQVVGRTSPTITNLFVRENKRVVSKKFSLIRPRTIVAVT